MSGPVSPFEIIFLVTIGFLAGTSNALVGGGTLFTFPVLLAAGLPPIIANTTTTVALVPGTFTSAYAYLPELHRCRRAAPLKARSGHRRRADRRAAAAGFGQCRVF